MAGVAGSTLSIAACDFGGEECANQETIWNKLSKYKYPIMPF